MTLPDKVQVGGLTYRVALADHDLMDAQELRGETDHEIQLIRIREGMAEEITLRVLLHEILHICFFTSGRRIEHDEEEELVRALQTPLFRFLRENPLDWLIPPAAAGSAAANPGRSTRKSGKAATGPADSSKRKRRVYTRSL